MQVDWVSAVSGAVAGLITGAISSLVAPWVAWAVEKRRDDRKHRRELIKEWRTNLQNVSDSYENAEVFMQSSAYASLRSHFSSDVLQQLEHPQFPFSPKASPKEIKEVSLNEVARLEQKWGLA